jgi:HEPN domain-containing protein
MCAQYGILTGFSPQLLTLLTDHAVASRYPGEEPTPEEARQSIEIAKTVRKFARQWLGLK